MSVGSCYGNKGLDSYVVAGGAIYFAFDADVEYVVVRNARELKS
jgi:hypothetical protein